MKGRPAYVRVAHDEWLRLTAVWYRSYGGWLLAWSVL